MKECVTHHHACDCREAHFAEWRKCAEQIAREYAQVLVYKVGKSTEASEALRRFKELGGKIYE